MSNLFDESSLAMIPTAYKEDKLYSLRPTDGSGDFTFSRGSNLAATRVGADGLIEKGRENILLQSNTFDTTWRSNGITLTGGKLGYDGSNNAWLAEKSNQSTRVEQDISGSGVTTFSAYLKAGTLNWSILNIQNVSQYYDLENGVLGTTSGTGSLRIDFGMEAVGNGWYRCFATTNQSYSIVRIYPATANNNNSGTSGNIYIQDAQLEQGLVATPYIETGATTAQAGILENTPRLDYSGGATCPSLLLEPLRTNLIRYSEYLADMQIAFGGVISLDSNFTNPSGQSGSYFIYDTDGGSQARFRVVNNGFTLGDKLSYSVFVKSDSSSSITIGGNYGDENCTFNVGTKTLISQGAAVDSYEIINFTNGWTRYIVNTTFTNFLGNGQCYSFFTTNATLSEKIYLWGHQLEQASYPTSYIPTYGSAVTRSGDISTASLNASSTGSFYVSLGKVQDPYFIVLGESFTVNSTRNDIAVAYSPTELKISLNGAIVVSATGTYDTSSLTSVQLGHYNGADQLGEGVKELNMFNAFLTDTELNALTV